MCNHEYCNNDLYKGLEAILDDPNRSYHIYWGNVIYTQAKIDKPMHQIILSNANGSSIAMDINYFVEQQRCGRIVFKVELK